MSKPSLGPRPHRRDLLKGVGAVAASSLLGSCTDKTPPSSPGSIEHIVLVMMENRSFDHYLGALTLEEGRTDVDGLVAGLSNPSPSGSIITPFHSNHLCLRHDPPHSWNSSHLQFSEGTNEGFVQAMMERHGSSVDPGIVMGYHNRSQLPISYALSDAYVTSQRWFSSVMSATWPNRFYSHAAQNLGIHGNELPDSGLFYSMRTIWDLLDEAGKSWSYYFSDLPFIALLEGKGQRDEVRWLEEFIWDCEHDTLPNVCMVEPGFGLNDDHPPHHPMLGQVFLATIHNALALSPAWERTLLVITYDEHGGFYDHVPPPLTDDNFVERGFDQLGFRVPSLVCGPWARTGHVDSTLRDHTSSLAHIEQLFGLEALTRRDAAANDLSSCLDHERLENGQPESPATLPLIELSQEEIQNSCAQDHRRGRYHTQQAELEAYLDATQNPHWRQRKKQLNSLPMELLELGERVNACIIR